MNPAPFPRVASPVPVAGALPGFLRDPYQIRGTMAELMGLQPPKLCCSSRGSIPVYLSLLPCSLADCPQIQCVHPYVAQQPDELSLELADVLNILDKTDDGMEMGWESLGKDGFAVGRQLQVSLSSQGEALASASQPEKKVITFS